MYHKRKYKVLNPQKYTGDYTNVIMRSSWETRFAIWCDTNPAVLKWVSEEIVVPYQCPTDGKMHRYYVDFKVTLKGKDGITKTYLVEVKPSKQTLPPTFPGKKTRRFLTEMATYAKNRAKWEAAKKYSESRGYHFMLITEQELGL